MSQSVQIPSNPTHPGFVVRPRVIAAACIIVLTALGWLYLGFEVSRSGSVAAALCRPLAVVVSPINIALLSGMWAAMTFAMMIPSAAPMIMTYSEIAEAGARKNVEVISPLIIVAGYSAVWLGFAVFATLLQLTLPTFSADAAGATLTAGLFAFAGLYQFTSLKHACLSRCRAPFQFFFTNWRTTTGGVFQLGLQQGIFCLGCCWAMMLVMLAAGAMNVVWMVALAIAMTAEKLVGGALVSRVLGGALLLVAALFALAALGVMPNLFAL